MCKRYSPPLQYLLSLLFFCSFISSHTQSIFRSLFPSLPFCLLVHFSLSPLYLYLFLYLPLSPHFYVSITGYYWFNTNWERKFVLHKSFTLQGSSCREDQHSKSWVSLDRCHETEITSNFQPRGKPSSLYFYDFLLAFFYTHVFSLFPCSLSISFYPLSSPLCSTILCTSYVLGNTQPSWRNNAHIWVTSFFAEIRPILRTTALLRTKVGKGGQVIQHNRFAREMYSCK